MTTTDKLEKLINTKAAIRQSIVDKGVTVNDSDTFASYPEKINEISGGSINFPKGLKFGHSLFSTIPKELLTVLELEENLDFAFYQCGNLIEIPLFDTSTAVSMNNMFYYCMSLNTIPTFDTSNVTDMTMIFSNCLKLETIPQLDFSKVTSLMEAFNFCIELVSLPKLNTISCSMFDRTFMQCSKLTTIEEIDFSVIGGNQDMFAGCDNLVTLNIKNLGKSDLSYYNFRDVKNWSYESMIFSLLTNSFDRVPAGKQEVTIELDSTRIILLTEEDKAAIKSKGYNIV